MADFELSPEGLVRIHARQLEAMALRAQLDVLQVTSLGMAQHNAIQLAQFHDGAGCYDELQFVAITNEMAEVVAQLSRLANDAGVDRDDTVRAIDAARAARKED